MQDATAMAVVVVVGAMEDMGTAEAGMDMVAVGEVTADMATVEEATATVVEVTVADTEGAMGMVEEVMDMAVAGMATVAVMAAGTGVDTDTEAKD